jgi:hypothetical protein
LRGHLQPPTALPPEEEFLVLIGECLGPRVDLVSLRATVIFIIAEVFFILFIIIVIIIIIIIIIIT